MKSICIRGLRPALAVVAFTGLLLAACTAPLQSIAGSQWDGSVGRIEATLNQALTAYESGQIEQAKQLAKDAYFDVFESSGMETAIRLQISARRAFEVEYGFTEVSQLLRSGAGADEVRGKVAGLIGMLRADASQLGGGSGGSTSGGFLTSFLIIVREGFEAILIIGAIIAYLVKSGNKDKVRIIYHSAFFALLASVVTAVAARYLFNISGASQELLEGITMLLATAVLFSVSFWLLSKVEAQKWQNYIKSKVASSLTTGNTLALWSVAFLAVYREGAETVLFYLALLSGSPSGQIGSISLGFAAGVVVLAVIFVAIRWGSLKIPLKPFFIGTGILLYYMAFVFAGKGIRELQEAGMVGTTIVPNLPSLEFLGVYPTWQGIALQSVLLLAALGGLAYRFFKKSPAVPARDFTV